MQEVFLKTLDNIKIAINHYSKFRNSVIIIAPGWFMTKDSKIFKKISEDLFKTFDIITMDFRGSGKSKGFYTFTAKEEQDLNCVINYAKKHYEKVFVLGFSLGGALSIISGAKNKNINGIIAVSAPTEFYKIENKMYSPNAWIPTLFQKFEPLRWMTIRAGNPFLPKEKPINLVGEITVPTLFIAGEKDPTVCPWHTQKLFENAKCKKDFILFEKARHAEDLYTDYPEKFITYCTEWLEQI